MVPPPTMVDAWEVKGGRMKRKLSLSELHDMEYPEGDVEKEVQLEDKQVTAEKHSTPMELFMLEAKLAWSKFHENTSAHGVPHVGQSKGVARTMFWLVTLVVMITMVLQMSWTLYMKYTLYEVTVNTKIMSDRKLVFPAVTICNMNALKLNALRDHERLSQVVFPDRNSPTPNEMASNNNNGIGVAPNVGVKTRVARSTQQSTKAISKSKTTTSKVSSTTENNSPTVQPPRVTTLNISKSKTSLASEETVSERIPTVAMPSATKKIPMEKSSTKQTPEETTGKSDTVSESVELDKKDTPTEISTVAPLNTKISKTKPAVTVSSIRQTPVAVSIKDTEMRQPPDQSLMMQPQNESKPSDSNSQGNVTEVDKLETTLKEKILEVMAGFPGETKKALGYEVDEMVVQCTYAGSSCNISNDFIHTYDQNYGNCYSLNWKDTAPLVSSQSGPQYGLQLLLNVRQDQYTRGLVDGIGMRVVIHSQTRMPFPNDEGILIPTGQLTYVGIKKKEMRRLGGSYGTCISEGQSDPTRNIYEELYGAGYTINGCLKTCFQRRVMSECGCANAALPIPMDAFNTTLTICSYSEKDSCFREKREAFYNSDITCDCPLPCNEVTYEQTVSAVPWPAMINDNDLKDVLKEGLDMDEYHRLFPEFSDAIITENLAKMVIYYDEFLVQKSTEQAAYGSNEILPDIGGILGLYAGVSVITALEFGELLFDICLAFIHALTRPMIIPK